MRHGSLFSGIGGFDLAAERMGWTNVFHVEQDAFCQTILKHHFPESIQHHDIKQFDATQYVGKIDIITGGFPCQPFSSAGARRGVSDDRYLWPEMLRVVQQVRPTYVLAENVRGLTSWNEGAVLDTCCTDLENEGYEVFPVLLGACAVNAPHERQRIWIVAAHTNGKECERWRGTGERERETSEQRGDRVQCAVARSGKVRDVANAGSVRVQGGLSTDLNRPEQKPQEYAAQHIRKDRHSVPFEEFPTVSPIRGADDGVSLRLGGITFPKWRKESIKAFGNAIVPQVAQVLFQVIQDIDNQLNV